MILQAHACSCLLIRSTNQTIPNSLQKKNLPQTLDSIIFRAFHYTCNFHKYYHIRWQHRYFRGGVTLGLSLVRYACAHRTPGERELACQQHVYLVGTYSNCEPRLFNCPCVRKQLTVLLLDYADKILHVQFYLSSILLWYLDVGL